MRKNLSVSKDERILFARQLALTIDSDVSLVEGLTLIKTKTDHPMIRTILESVIEEISEGTSLPDAMKKHEKSLTTFFVNMVAIGEQSGNLTQILEQLADTYEKEMETTKKVKSALTYPAILSALMFGVIILLIVKILPMFDDVIGSLGGEMPGVTQALLSVGLFIQNYFVIICGIVVVCIVGGISYARTEKGALYIDQLKFRLPIQKQIHASVTATLFARNLGLLIRSGIAIPNAFEMIQTVMTNKYVNVRLKDATEKLHNGKAVDEVIEELKLFPWILIKLFSIAQLTGHMDQMLFKAADEMEKETNLLLNKLTTVIEPLLILILSIVVGIILLSVVLPVVNIMNAIG